MLFVPVDNHLREPSHPSVVGSGRTLRLRRHRAELFEGPEERVPPDPEQIVRNTSQVPLTRGRDGLVFPGPAGDLFDGTADVLGNTEAHLRDGAR